jgi:hypothetical protein
MPSVFGGLLLALALALPCAGAERPEHEVKAAFVYHFGKYVRWPSAPAAAGSPFVVAVLGEDPFGAALDDIARGNRIENRPVLVRRAATLAELGECQVLFISASEEPKLEEILAALAKSPTLTVSDIPQFVARGGMIGLIRADRRVQFEVNLDAVERANLSLSSQLLRLAKALVDTRTR